MQPHGSSCKRLPQSQHTQCDNFTFISTQNQSSNAHCAPQRFIRYIIFNLDHNGGRTQFHFSGFILEACALTLEEAFTLALKLPYHTHAQPQNNIQV